MMGVGGETPNHAGCIWPHNSSISPLDGAKAGTLPRHPPPGRTCRVLFIVRTHFTLPQQQPVAQTGR